jgi:NAD(P)-dependent dehydrogenase (short-subunit alcohol dehydrogenase family)
MSQRPVALVTGGGTGIGRAIAERLAREGYDIGIASRSPAHLAEGRQIIERTGARVLPVPTDVRVPDQVEELMRAMVKEFGRLDVLVNNAAGNFVVRSEDLSPNGWRAVVGIVLDGTFFCCRAAFPHLSRSESASILNIVASYAWLAGPGTVHSAAAKAGVVALTRTLAVEWADRHIRVNAIAPGPVHTEGTDRQLWTDSGLVDRVTGDIPMRRFGSASEIADAAWFLTGPTGRYITGEVLTVDGGQSLGGGLMDLLGSARSERPRAGLVGDPP